MRISIRWKLLALFLLIVIAGLAVAYFFLIPKLREYFEENLQADLENQLMVTKALLESYILDEGMLRDRADEIADRIAEHLNLRVTLISMDGEVLGDSDLTPEQLIYLENHSDRPEIRDAREKGIGISKRWSSTVKKNLLYLAVPLGREKQVAFLRFAVPLEKIEGFVADIRKIVIGALFVVLLLSVVVSASIWFLVTKPLTEMTTIARAYGDGDFSRKPSIRSKDEIGELAKAMGSMVDEIKSRIVEVEQEGAKLRTVLSSMFEGIMVTDEKGQILLVNPSMRKWLSLESDPVGKKPIEVIRYITVQEVVDKIIENKQEVLSNEIRISLPEEKVLQINGAPILRDGKLEGVVLVFHDITRLKLLERIRQDFVANVSHELRTPIASIKGYSETLLEGAVDDKSVAKDFLRVIYQESERLASLIDDLLDLSKIESGRMEMEFAPCELHPIVAACVEALRKKAEEKGVKVLIAFGDEIPKVMADERRLSQVLLNLIDNAIKYTPEGGSVTISASQKDMCVQVDVSDTGIGIPEKDLPRIFERFYRVDKARSRELGGTGLGLAIVKHIVLAHGGDVWVKSRLGSGSVFSFTIPKA